MSTGTPLVSVIIPCFNATRYIPEALDSLRAQTFRDFETVLVNDGCPDTENLERALEPYRSEIVYLKSGQWASPAGSRNNGIQVARGRYLAMLDADDLFEPDYLRVHTGFLEAHPEYDLVYSNAQYFGEAKWDRDTVVDRALPAGETRLRELVLLERTMYVGVTARRDSLARAGLFDPQVRGGEDWDLWMRLLRSGGRIWYTGQQLARYRFHAGMQNTRKMENLRNHLGVLHKHLNLPGLSTGEREWFLQGSKKIEAAMDLYQGKQALYAGRRAEAIERLSKANRVLRSRRITVAILGLRLAPRLLYSYIHRKYPTEYIYLH